MSNTENTAIAADERMMNRAEAAAFLDISDRTLTNWLNDFKVEVFYERGVTRKVPKYKAADIERIKEAKSNPANRAVRGTVVDTANTATPKNDNSANVASSANTANPSAALAVLQPQMPHLSEQGGIAAFTEAMTLSQTAALRFVANEDPSRLRAKATLSFAEAQIVTGVPERQLKKAAKDGLIKEVKLGRMLKVKTSDVIEYAESLFE